MSPYFLKAMNFEHEGKYPPHTQDTKKWSQGEAEEHAAALYGDRVCYYCLAGIKAAKKLSEVK